MSCKHGFPAPNEMMWIGKAPPRCPLCRIEKLEEENTLLRKDRDDRIEEREKLLKENCVLRTQLNIEQDEHLKDLHLQYVEELRTNLADLQQRAADSANHSALEIEHLRETLNRLARIIREALEEFK